MKKLPKKVSRRKSDALRKAISGNPRSAMNKVIERVDKQIGRAVERLAER